MPGYSPPSPQSSAPSLSPSPNFGSSLSTNYNIYPRDAWFCICGFLVGVGLFTWGSVLHSKLATQRRPSNDGSEESPAMPDCARSPSWSLARLPLALVNVFRVVAFRWTIGFYSYDLRVVDIFLTFAYIAFLLAWTFGGDEQLQLTTSNAGVWSNRAGILAASQFPLVTALGTKNNIVSLITGIDHVKLNFFHRVAARTCFALLLIHLGGEIYSMQRFSSYLAETWVRLGIMAVSSLAILLIVSLRAIRARFYEVFFYTHFITVLIFLVGAYYHTKDNRLSYWIWPSFIIWAFDRLTRFARVVFSNHLYFGFGSRAALQDATTELLSDDFVRVRVRRPPHFHWSPGQTAYLIMPSVSRFPLEAHPFSISTVDSVLFRPPTSDPAMNEDVSAKTAQWNELVFLINVRGGFTKRLRDDAARRRTVKLFIDGPYGSAPSIGAYDTSILVAGGSGVTYTLPVFLNAIETIRNGSGRCRRLVFIWAVRDASHIDWISDMLSRANSLAPSWLELSIRVFVTRGQVPLNDRELADPEQVLHKENAQGWIVPSSVQVENGRPDLKGILLEEVNSATGCLSVSVCGSQGLTKSVRQALRFPVSGFSSVLKGGPSVTLHIESFGYA